MSRKDEMREEFQTVKTSGYADQVKLRSGRDVLQLIEMLYLFSPSRLREQFKLFTGFTGSGFCKHLNVRRLGRFPWGCECKMEVRYSV